MRSESEVRARELLADCLDEWGCPSEAENVRNGEDLESYESELRLIETLLRFGLDTPRGHAHAALAAQGEQQPEVNGDWYTSEGFGSYVIDLGEDPENSLSVMLQRDGTVAVSLYSRAGVQKGCGMPTLLAAIDAFAEGRASQGEQQDKLLAELKVTEDNLAAALRVVGELQGEQVAQDRRFADLLLSVINDVQDELGFTDEEKECSNGSVEIIDAIRELKEAARQPVGQEPVARQAMATCPRDGTVVILHWGEDHVSPGWWSAPVAPVKNDDGTWPSDFGGFPWAFIDIKNGSAFVNHAVDTEYGPTHWSRYTAPPAQPQDSRPVTMRVDYDWSLRRVAKDEAANVDETFTAGVVHAQPLAPAAAVPDAKDYDPADTTLDRERKIGWNECRKAVLAAAPAPGVSR